MSPLLIIIVPSPKKKIDKWNVEFRSMWHKIKTFKSEVICDNIPKEISYTSI